MLIFKKIALLLLFSFSLHFHHLQAAQYKAKAIAAGQQHALAILSDQSLWAWGDNSYGQLGNGSNINSNRLIKVAGINKVIAISAGAGHSLALKEDGSVWSWGNNQQGQLGNGSNEDSSLPVQINIENIVQITAGSFHSLALKKDGTVWAWGNNQSGQLGVGTHIDSNIPQLVGNLVSVKTIAAGHMHSLAILNTDEIFAWGLNQSGQIGNEINDHTNVPVQLSLISNPVTCAAGWNHSLVTDGTYLWTWGEQLESPLTIDLQSSPLTFLKGGDSFSLALQKDGSLLSWGINDKGQLGDGTNTNAIFPIQVSISKAKEIAAGKDFSLAILNDGIIWGWGENSHGQLGNGTNSDANSPVQAKINIDSLSAQANPTSQIICEGTKTNIALSSDIPETKFKWQVKKQFNVTGATHGSGNKISQILKTKTKISGHVIYTIYPTLGDEQGSPIEVIVYVYPKPNAIAQPNELSIYTESKFHIPLYSFVKGTTFSWTTEQIDVMGALPGSGFAISQHLNTISHRPGKVIYTVTPSANGFKGDPIEIEVIVNPLPDVCASPSTQIICTQFSTDISLSSNNPKTAFKWTVEQNNVSGAKEGSGSSIVQQLTSLTEEGGTVTYTITPFIQEVEGNSIKTVVKVAPEPIARANFEQTSICSGSTCDIALSSNQPDTLFNWTVDSSDAEGAVAGSGSSINQTLTATKSTPGTVTYTITPTTNGYSGKPIQVVVKVHPIPIATATPTTQSIESDTEANIELFSNLPNTTFKWTVTETQVIGASNGSGNVIAQTLNATTKEEGKVVYLITPIAGGWEGTPIIVEVRVKKSPPLPPHDFKCVIHRKRIPLSYSSHYLYWNPSPDAKVIGYRLYNGEELIGTILGNKKCKIVLKKQDPRKHTSYKLVAFDKDDLESVPIEPIMID